MARLIDYLAPTPVFDQAAKVYGYSVTTFLVPAMRNEKGNPLWGRVRGAGWGYLMILDASLEGKELVRTFLHEIGHLKAGHVLKSPEHYEENMRELSSITGEPIELVKQVMDFAHEKEYEKREDAADVWASAEYQRLKEIAGDKWDSMSAEEILSLVV